MNTETVTWERLLPEEFLARQAKKSLVFLPLGICEPHGHIAPFGLDTLKAEYLCVQAAKQFGGIVAPTLGYQIHEAGYHAQWLEEVAGEVNPYMTAMPPDVMLRFFLYQLRAFANAGFDSVFVLSGHSGGNQHDLRLVADCFMKKVEIDVIVKSDPELVTGLYEGDHAGKYEISQLLYLYPELIQIGRLNNEKTHALGRFAQGEDASQANAELGKHIIEASLVNMGLLVENIGNPDKKIKRQKLNYLQTETIWNNVVQRRSEWITVKPKEGQPPVSETSQWKDYENC